MTDKSQTNEILPLTGLRFIAALYVFIFHIHLKHPLAPESSFLANLIGQGAIGMSLFFVLSGFVLAHRYSTHQSTYRQYLVNRFSRIYPVYAVVAIATLPWIGISLDGQTAREVARHAVALITLVVANVLVLQAWFPQMFWQWNNGGSWSISVEVFCYLLLPFILPKLMRQRSKTLVWVAFGAYVLAVAPGVSLVAFGGDQGLAYYSMPIYRLPEFVLGICVSLAVQRMTVSPTKTTALQAVAGAALIIYLGVVGPFLPMWITHNWIVLPVIAITIFSTAQSFGVLSKFLGSSLMVWLGKISYSFYSLQLLVLLVLKSHYAAIVKAVPALGNNFNLLVASFIVLLVLSAAGYHLIEEPARLWIKRRGSRSRVVHREELVTA